jgi:hypothetical protein
MHDLLNLLVVFYLDASETEPVNTNAFSVIKKSESIQKDFNIPFPSLTYAQDPKAMSKNLAFIISDVQVLYMRNNSIVHSIKSQQGYSIETFFCQSSA